MEIVAGYNCVFHLKMAFLTNLYMETSKIIYLLIENRLSNPNVGLNITFQNIFKLNPHTRVAVSIYLAQI